MAKYIDKDALVAEIDSKKKYAQTMGDNAINGSMQQFYDGMKQGCVDLLSFIDTLEVKEVDIEKKKLEWIEQLCKYFKANYLYVSGHESFISDFRMYAKNLK